MPVFVQCQWSILILVKKTYKRDWLKTHWSVIMEFKFMLFDPLIELSNNNKEFIINIL
jgi:hypothetical protein